MQQTLTETSQHPKGSFTSLSAEDLQSGRKGMFGVRTCGVALNDWQVIHLQRCITPAPGELHHVVLAVVHGLGLLLDVDVVRPHVEDHRHMALFLQTDEKAKEDAVTSEEEKREKPLNIAVLTVTESANGIDD